MNTHGKLKQGALGFLALALVGLLGCIVGSNEAVAVQPTCELNVGAICENSMENYFSEEAVRPARATPLRGARLVPLVTPLKLPGGKLAAAVDCHVAIDLRGVRLVYAYVAISPRSLRAVEHLRDRGLCVNAGPEPQLAFGYSVYPVRSR